MCVRVPPEQPVTARGPDPSRLRPAAANMPAEAGQGCEAAALGGGGGVVKLAGVAHTPRSQTLF